MSTATGYSDRAFYPVYPSAQPPQLYYQPSDPAAPATSGARDRLAERVATVERHVAALAAERNDDRRAREQRAEQTVRSTDSINALYKQTDATARDVQHVRALLTAAASRADAAEQRVEKLQAQLDAALGELRTLAARVADAQATGGRAPIDVEPAPAVAAEPPVGAKRRARAAPEREKRAKRE